MHEYMYIYIYLHMYDCRCINAAACTCVCACISASSAGPSFKRTNEPSRRPHPAHLRNLARQKTRPQQARPCKLFGLWMFPYIACTVTEKLTRLSITSRNPAKRQVCVLHPQPDRESEGASLNPHFEGRLRLIQGLLNSS